MWPGSMVFTTSRNLYTYPTYWKKSFTVYKHSFDQCKGQFAKAAIIYETRLWIGMYFDDNSESHQWRTPDEGLFPTGSIEKMMLFVCMRERLAQERQGFEGFNPVAYCRESLPRRKLVLSEGWQINLWRFNAPFHMRSSPCPNGPWGYLKKSDKWQWKHSKRG